MKLKDLLIFMEKEGFIKEEEPSEHVPPDDTYIKNFSINCSFPIVEKELDMDCDISKLDDNGGFNLLRFRMEGMTFGILCAIQDKLEGE
jgi:hypothetical protein